MCCGIWYGIVYGIVCDNMVLYGMTCGGVHVWQNVILKPS